jgi:LacI family transcriptional regulator
MAGIRDIAERAGASIATVSRVINGSGYVSAATRARVEAAIAETGYSPNAGARLMRTAESRMVGLLLPALDLHFFGILAHEVEQALSARGYRALICSTAEDAAREEEYVAALLAQRVEGVLAVSVTEDSRAFGRLLSAGVPVVGIDRALPGTGADVVKADHARGLAIAAEHVLALGHRRIAVIGAPGHSAPIRERLDGARRALAAAGVAPVDVRIGTVHSFEACRDLVLSMLDEGHRPTAILGTTDIAAIGAIHACAQRGLSVPGDVSVTGFDDLPAARYVMPQLTTVAHPYRSIARHAVAVLLARIAGTEPPPTPPEVAVLSLVARGTTAPPPEGG